MLSGALLGQSKQRRERKRFGNSLDPSHRPSPEYFHPKLSSLSRLGRILLPPRWGEGLALLGAI